MKVGFLGLGVMGKQMASTLLSKGVKVTVWNRTASRCDELVKAGATALRTPAEVVDSCDVVHGMLSDPAASENVVFGTDGVLSAARAGTSYIDHSTIDETTGVKIFDAIKGKGARFLSAPVSGGWRDAAKGELLFIAGGDRTLFDESTTAGGGMAGMGHRHWFVGETPVQSARAKLMLQIMMGSMVGALSETLALADKSGLDQSQILDMLSHSAMSNPLCAAKGKLMIDGNYAPNFQVYLQQKDLRLTLALADQLEMSLPITAAVNAQYIKARQLGHADSDFAAIRDVYEAEKRK